MNKKSEQYNTTHRHIQDCFLEMLGEMDFSKITITEIACRAKINRKTFYLHYASLEALLEECTKRCVDTAYEGIEKALIYGVADGKIATRTYAVFEEDRVFWRWLLTEPDCDEAAYKCQRLAVQVMNNRQRMIYPDLCFKDNIPLIFTVVSLWYMLRLWLVWDHETMSLTEFDHIIDRLLSEGTISLLSENLKQLKLDDPNNE